MNFSWTEPYPELHKVCKLFQMNEIANPIKYSYRPLTGILQDGPQCGLVALAIALGKSDKETVQNIYQTAKDQNYTNHGEMFSVQNMTNLANLVSPDKFIAEVYDGDLNNEIIREFLLSGGMVLVPYDTNKDNSPGLFGGHKAHWAVISGGIMTSEDFFVIARHGKVKNVAVWKLSKLAESNKQLYETLLNPELLAFNIPNGGISGPLGLNHKSVLITCADYENIT